MSTEPHPYLLAALANNGAVTVADFIRCGLTSPASQRRQLAALADRAGRRFGAASPQPPTRIAVGTTVRHVPTGRVGKVLTHGHGATHLVKLTGATEWLPGAELVPVPTPPVAEQVAA